MPQVTTRWSPRCRPMRESKAYSLPTQLSPLIVRPMLKTIVLTSLATLLVVIVAYNLAGKNEKQIDRRLTRQYDIADPLFLRELSVLLGPPVVGGNRYTALNNGDEIFPAMLAGIRSARHTITFESYIYWSGDIGRQVADALSERARAGIKVHVLLDAMGSAKIDDSVVQMMQAAGVEVLYYHPVRWYTLGKLNNRTHRKLLVIDGVVGFTGGVGIAPEWTGNAQDPDHWRDMHFKIEGPVVGQLQSVFLDNWIKVSGDVPHGEHYFPALSDAGTGLAQVFSSSPSGGSESMALMYLLAITAAKRSIDLSAAYFVPDDEQHGFDRSPSARRQSSDRGARRAYRLGDVPIGLTCKMGPVA